MKFSDACYVCTLVVVYYSSGPKINNYSTVKIFRSTPPEDKLNMGYIFTFKLNLTLKVKVNSPIKQ